MRLCDVSLYAAEAGDELVDLVAQLRGQVGEHAARLQSRVALIERAHAAGEQVRVSDERARAVDVRRQRVEALQRVDVAAHRGQQRGRVRAAGLRQAVDGVLRGAGFADGPGDERLAGGLAHTGSLHIGIGHADQRNDQDEYDDVQKTDELFVLAPAAAGLK